MSRITFRTFVLLSSSIVMVSCSGKKGGSAAPVRVTANFQGAVSIGLFDVNSESSAGSQSIGASSNGRKIGHLKKIRSNGDVEDVFNSRFEIYNVLVSDNYVYTSGIFQNILNEDGEAIDCYLLASERSNSSKESRCLSQFRVGTGAPGGDNSSYDGIGMLVRGDTIYFIADDRTQEKSMVMAWTEGSDTTELKLEFSTTNTNTITDIYGSTMNNNICALSPGLNSFAGRLTCGDPGSSNWTNVSAGGGGLSPTTFQVGDYLHGNSMVKLSDLSVDDTLGIYPNTIDDVCYMNDGSAAAINSLSGGSSFLYHIRNDGSSVPIDETIQWDQLISRGNYCWAIGNGQLRRIDRANATLDPTDYLQGTSMLQITDISFSINDLIRVDGTGSGGLPVTVYADTIAGTVAVENVNRPKFLQIISLQ